MYIYLLISQLLVNHMYIYIQNFSYARASAHHFALHYFRTFCTLHSSLSISGILGAAEISNSLICDSLIMCCGFRFFHQFILLFAVHLSSVSLFRFLASVFQTINAAFTAASYAALLLFSLCGFIITPGKLSRSLFSNLIIR